MKRRNACFKIAADCQVHGSVLPFSNRIFQLTVFNPGRTNIAFLMPNAFFLETE